MKTKTIELTEREMETLRFALRFTEDRMHEISIGGKPGEKFDKNTRTMAEARANAIGNLVDTIDAGE